MNDRKKSLAPLGGLYSGKIIGAAVKALSLDQGVLTRRTARRFFDGRSVSEHSRKEILKGVAEILVQLGIVPTPRTLGHDDFKIETGVANAISLASTRWDRLLARIQSRSGVIIDRQQAAERFIRLVVVDLALRVFALLRLSGQKPSRPATPSWAEANGGGKALRQLIEKAGLTRHQLAARVGVSYNSVDNWLDGIHRPEPEHVAALATSLASPGTDSRQLEQDIRRMFAFAHVADLLEPWIGREQVIELGTALVRFVWLITEDVLEMDRPPIEEVSGMEWVAFTLGTSASESNALLRNLALVEPDDNWRDDIIAATLPWELSFELTAVESGLPRVSAGLAQDPMDAIDPKIPSRASKLGIRPGDPAREAITRFLKSETKRARGLITGRESVDRTQLLETGIAKRRVLVRQFPLSPQSHYELGSFLGMAGKNLLRQDQVDEGVLECKLAAKLMPNWDAPAVETGIILANVGRYSEALDELVQATTNLPYATPHLRFALGYVLMKLFRFDEALGHFESVIDDRPDYALSLLHAAGCAFAIGDKVKGRRYATGARSLGEPGEYNAWKSGKYSSRTGKLA